ncbi:carboxypeptidase A5 isoform X1 [Equus przewalskii]|uniref:Carboxypeptidase A5 isoform X1 n=1 Tax=Equus przewalskii TaxID=9798 RepID=A0ABM2EQT5_EQUPR|nr:PREDICTED: carboxypeptidase A5 isoform X1 [Equus przewalskii]XP_008511048.1 PREDICTED: carboxypeptidase A5 isoform X1 [Equus przewalskii]XP_008511057.1 PREDICTED: carboxypeptidase A5 isoform X1 [Equus przewalskii]XP_008511064.1 PREDICTED: carboxypeptidase A5 isoform X1 [Equus przewalskii]
MQGTHGGGVGPGLSPVDKRTLLVCSFILAAALGQMNFTGDQVLRVLAKNEKELSLLKELEGLKPQKVDFWRGPARPSLPVDMRVPFSELTDVKAYLGSHGLAYSIMIKDVQVLLDEEREAMAKSRRLERSTNSFSYSSYHTLEEIYSWIDNFVTEHSDIVSKIRIGHSFENRSILVLKFSTGGSQRGAIWIDTGIHSREWITHATGIWTAKKIVSEYGKDRSLTNILNAMDIFMEIVTNPDGFAFTHSMNRLWRKNKSTRPGSFCIGVDLNRNWKSGFGGNGSNNNPCSETYRGPSPQSEPEVAAIVDFITAHGNIKALISIHSYSQMLMYPYGHSLEPVSNQKELMWPAGSPWTGPMTTVSSTPSASSSGILGTMASCCRPHRSSLRPRRRGWRFGPSWSTLRTTPTSNATDREGLSSSPRPGVPPETQVMHSPAHPPALTP